LEVIHADYGSFKSCQEEKARNETTGLESGGNDRGNKTASGGKRSPSLRERENTGEESSSHWEERKTRRAGEQESGTIYIFTLRVKAWATTAGGNPKKVVLCKGKRKRETKGGIGSR